MVMKRKNIKKQQKKTSKFGVSNLTSHIVVVDKKKEAFKKFILVTTLIVLISMLIIGVTIGALAIVSRDVSLSDALLPTSAYAPVFYDKDGDEMDYKNYAPLNADGVPENIKNAFVALEDKRFFEHKGFDTKRIGGAILSNIKSKSAKEGASTITQQLIKNTHLSSQKTLKRKLNELYLATELEKKYSKQEILAMYLSAIYFGNGMYGIKNASDFYFGKNIDELTVGECAVLAGIVKNPSKYNPKSFPSKAKARRNFVLSLMHNQNYISNIEFENAKLEDIETTTENYQNKAEQQYIKQCTNEIMDKLEMTKFQFDKSNFQVFTYFDKNVSDSLRTQILIKDNYKNEELDGSGVVVDNKSNGIIAYCSTLPYVAKRQPGSILKPLVAYAPAFELGILTAATPIKDEVKNFGGYSPKNFNDKYYGWTTPREAIKKSMNTVACQTINFLKTENAVKYGTKLGLPLTAEDNNLALALGSTKNGLDVFEIASAYKTFANNGFYSKANFVRFVAHKDGSKVLENNAIGTKVFTANTSALITDILVDTVKSGTARTLSTLSFQVASKTGTVGSKENDQNSDSWNVAYTTDHTVTIWHGNKNSYSTGGGHPTMSTKNLMKEMYAPRSFAHSKLPFNIRFKKEKKQNAKLPTPQNFKTPLTLLSLGIDSYSLKNEQRLLLASKNTPKTFVQNEYFLPDFAPTEFSELFDNITAKNMQVDVQEVVASEQNKKMRVQIKFDAEPIFKYIITKQIGFLNLPIGNIENAKGEIEFFDEIEKNESFVTYNVIAYYMDDEIMLQGNCESKILYFN